MLDPPHCWRGHLLTRRGRWRVPIGRRASSKRVPPRRRPLAASSAKHHQLCFSSSARQIAARLPGSPPRPSRGQLTIARRCWCCRGKLLRCYQSNTKPARRLPHSYPTLVFRKECPSQTPLQGSLTTTCRSRACIRTSLSAAAGLVVDLGRPPAGGTASRGNECRNLTLRCYLVQVLRQVHQASFYVCRALLDAAAALGGSADTSLED